MLPNCGLWIFQRLVKIKKLLEILERFPLLLQRFIFYPATFAFLSLDIKSQTSQQKPWSQIEREVKRDFFPRPVKRQSAWSFQSTILITGVRDCLFTPSCRTRIKAGLPDVWRQNFSRSEFSKSRRRNTLILSRSESSISSTVFSPTSSQSKVIRRRKYFHPRTKQSVAGLGGSTHVLCRQIWSIFQVINGEHIWYGLPS